MLPAFWPGWPQEPGRRPIPRASLIGAWGTTEEILIAGTDCEFLPIDRIIAPSLRRSLRRDRMHRGSFLALAFCCLGFSAAAAERAEDRWNLSDLYPSV